MKPSIPTISDRDILEALGETELVVAYDATQEHRRSRHAQPLTARPFVGLADLRDQLEKQEQIDRCYRQRSRH